MEFPLAVGILGVILLLGVWGPFVHGGEEAPLRDVGWALLIVGVPVVNLLRYRRAPWGCLPLALSVLTAAGLFAAGVDPLAGVIAVAVPNGAFLLGELLLGPSLRRARRARRLAELEDDALPLSRVLVLLGDREDEVSERAAKVLASRSWADVGLALAEPLASRLPPRGLLPALEQHAAQDPATVRPWIEARLPGARFELRQGLGRLLGLHGGALPEDLDGRLGHALGQLEVDARAGGAALVATLAEPRATPAQRQAALEALDRAPADDVLAAARAALDAGPGTAELAWVFHDLGQAPDGPRVARLLGSDDYDVANAAVDALAGVLGRGKLGEHEAATLAGVETARAQLRAEHPPGENRLADGLVQALEELRADLEQRAPHDPAPEGPGKAG
ncbi:MAG: hypothetical protein R3F62_28325 [Planctomycetota bacterium]